MKTKRLYIHTIGCQMNVYDSDQIASVLHPRGYHPTRTIESADLIIVNTCAIRAKAEQKAFSFLGRLAELKKRNPHLIVAMGGCVAQQEGDRVFRRVPAVDLVFGPRAIGRLPDLVERIAARRCRIVDLAQENPDGPLLPGVDAREQGAATRFVTIMQGCDNFCTYCVVPYVRGRETSRPPEQIIDEIKRLVAAGVREVTLLGQNVNSYGQKEGLCSFARLLRRIDRIEGLERIRFTTSHPKDLSSELIEAFAELDRLCRHIHLPVQSGSDRILRRMNRKYTRAHYLARIDRLRDRCPDIAITTDVIVGFPGEEQQDVEQTLDLMRRVAYDSLFAFKYSDRPNAAAARFAPKVSREDKRERLQQVLELQQQYTLKKNQAMVGSVEQILVEGLSKRRADGGGSGAAEWMGRTSTNKIVNFSGENGCGACHTMGAGRMVAVRIEKALAHSLWGKRIPADSASLQMKGEKSYAA